MRNLLNLLVVLLVFSAMAACSGKKGKTDEKIVIPDPRKDMTMIRSGQDTAEILKLSQNFLESLKTHDIDAAMKLLYVVENNTARPLEAERRQQLEKTLSAFPIADYTIDELLLYSDSDTEVRYTIEMFKKSANDDRPNTLKGALNPYRVNGTWFLTIENEKVENNFRNN